MRLHIEVLMAQFEPLKDVFSHQGGKFSRYRLFAIVQSDVRTRYVQHVFQGYLEGATVSHQRSPFSNSTASML